MNGIEWPFPASADNGQQSDRVVNLDDHYLRSRVCDLYFLIIRPRTKAEADAADDSWVKRVIGRSHRRHHGVVASVKDSQWCKVDDGTRIEFQNRL